MDVLVVIGDQDGYHVDDELVSAPIWVSDVVKDVGVPALFVVQARRIALWSSQSRSDVIDAVRHHELGLHGRDVHPTAPEMAEHLGWRDGVAALGAAEREEVELFGRVFGGPPACLSEHRCQSAPQLFAVARELRLPYVFGLPGLAPCWYAGALNLPFDAMFPAVFDDVLHDDSLFDGMLARLRAHVEACATPLLILFVCHPERLCYVGPVERWRFGNGTNVGEVPRGVDVRRSRTEVERALTNLRTLLAWLRDVPDVTPVTLAELVRRYGSRPETLDASELAAVATQAVATRQIVGGAATSAAEVLVGWAEAVADRSGAGRSPVRRRDVLGPLAVPPLVPSTPTLSREALPRVAGRLIAEADANGHLPAVVDGIGLGSLYGALAAGYLGRTTDLDGWPRYPAGAVSLSERFRRCADDPLLKPGLATDAIATHAALQSWTLAPAVRQ